MPLDVIDVRGESQRIAQNIAQLAKTLPDIATAFSDKAAAQKLALEHPELAQQIAKATRVQIGEQAKPLAAAVGTMPTSPEAAAAATAVAKSPKVKSPAEMLGFTKGVGDALTALFPETPEEQYSRAAAGKNLGGKQAKAQEAQLDVAPIVAKAEGAKAQLEGNIAAELLSKGYVHDEAQARLVDVQARNLSAQQKLTFMNIVTKMLPTMSPEDQAGYVMSTVNPQFLDWKAQQQQLKQASEQFAASHDLASAEFAHKKYYDGQMLELQRNEMEMRKAGAAADRVAAFWRSKGELFGMMKDIVGQFSAIESGKMPKELRPILQTELENLASLSVQLDPTATVTLMAEHQNKILPNKWEWTRYVPGSEGDPAVGQAVAKVLSGELSLAQINKDPDVLPARKAIITRAVTMIQTQAAIENLQKSAAPPQVTQAGFQNMGQVLASGGRPLTSGRSSHGAGKPMEGPLAVPSAPIPLSVLNQQYGNTLTNYIRSLQGGQ